MSIETIASGSGTNSNAELPTIFICVFSYGGIEANTMWTLVKEMRLMDQLGIKFLLHNVHGDALISRSRSKALSEFMTVPDLNVCVMVDHDMQWEPGALAALAVKAHERKACVAGLYACRGFGRGTSSRIKIPNGQELKLKAGEDKLLDADYLATGFLAIPKLVAEEVLKAGLSAQNDFVNKNHETHALNTAELGNQALHACAYNDGSLMYDFFRPICVSASREVIDAAKRLDEKVEPLNLHEYLSEDWSFSWRCTKANPNRPLYVWTKPWLTHIGSHAYSLLDAYRKL